MNQGQASVSDMELSAYLDGELAAERHAEIDACLAHQPACQARLDAWRRQGHQLRATYGRIAQEPLPRRLSVSLRPPIQTTNVSASAQTGLKAAQAQHSAEPALRAAPAPGHWPAIGLTLLGLSAIVGMAALGLLHGVQGQTAPSALLAATSAAGPGLVRHAAEAHIAFAPQGDQWLDVRSADPPVLAAAAARAGLEIRLPAAPAELRPLGLRLTPGPGGLAALVLFDSQSAGPVSLFVTRGAQGEAPGLVLRETGGVTIVTFSVGGIAYALTGTTHQDRLVDWAGALRLGLLQPRSLRGS